MTKIRRYMNDINEILKEYDAELERLEDALNDEMKLPYDQRQQGAIEYYRENIEITHGVEVALMRVYLKGYDYLPKEKDNE